MITKYKLPIFIGIVIVILFISDRLINPFDQYVDETTTQINEIDAADSVVIVATEQIDEVQYQNHMMYSELDSLDNTVKMNELTIEEQVNELNRLLILAKFALEEAQAQKDIAIEIQERATIARMNANKEKQMAQLQYSILQAENAELKDEIQRLLDMISMTNFNSIENDTIVMDALEIDPVVDEKKIKNKKNNRDKKKN